MSRGRRTFIEQVGTGFMAAVGVPFVGRTGSTTEPWLDNLTGAHRQFFDVPVLKDPTPLLRVTNFLNAYNTAYGLADGRLNVLFGAHGAGLGFVLSDPLWSKFRIGERYGVTDPESRKAAARNVFAAEGRVPGGAVSVQGLKSRGVRFLACRQTVVRWSRELAQDGFGDAATIERELAAGLLPGVFEVPAMVLAANRAQESGMTYVYVA